MSVTDFFEKMIGLHQQRTEQKQNHYRGLLAAIATGEELNPVEVDRLLEEAGKSIDDLKNDVEAYERRMALKAQVASLPKLDHEFTNVQQQIATADIDLEAAERKHDEVTAPLYDRLQEIKDAQSDASRARQELFESCEDPELDREWSDIHVEINRLRQSHADIATQAAYLDTNNTRLTQLQRINISHSAITVRVLP